MQDINDKDLIDSQEYESKKAKPKTEIELRRMETIYIQNPDDRKNSDEFILLLKTYARSMALKMLKNKNKYLPPERVDEISTDAAILFISQYEKEGWMVKDSFGGALKFKVIEAMYSQASDEQNSSLNQELSEDDNNKEIIDLVSSGNCMPWDYTPHGGKIKSDNPIDIVSESANAAYGEVDQLIEECYELLPYKTFARLLIYLVLQFRKPKAKNAINLYSERFLTSREADTFEMLLLELYNRIAQHVLLYNFPTE